MKKKISKQQQTPLQIVVLGGTGDLTVRKLLPALFNLFSKNLLPDKFSIIGNARSPYTHEEYQQFVAEALSKEVSKQIPGDVEKFCKHIFYVAGDFDTNKVYLDLHEQMARVDELFKATTNKIYYLAVPPDHYPIIFSGLHLHKLDKAYDSTHGWAKVLVEKPFGSDYLTAQKLDSRLGSLFKEEQIYRIDHYLAKEAVQNILSFRFANRMLTGSWNNQNIKCIRINMYETLTVGKRGKFYDGIGALRDVGQNHLLQLLALLTMREPQSFNHNHVRYERARILKTLRCLNKKNIADKFIQAQYVGYKKTPGVQKGSTTETYFELEAELTDANWRGVPIYLTAGKALNENKVDVEIEFKDVNTGPFLIDSCNTTGNLIKLTISPEQSMHITLNAKAPGLGYQMETRTLSFKCEPGENEITNSYEKVLLDCINSDQTLFTTTIEVLAQWRFINPILKYQNLVPLLRYKQGSEGPKKTLLQ